MEQENYIPVDFTIEALRGGDEQAFEKVFHLYYKAICYFSERMVKHSSAAEDVAGETFIKLWNRRETFRSLSHIRSFLYKAAYRACLDYLKVESRTARRESVFNESLPPEEDFYLELIRTEMLHTLYRAIRQLPEQCGNVITMSYLDGKKNEEIAKQLNISVQTVKNHKSKGIKLLKRQFPDAATGLSILLILRDLLH